MVLTKQIMLSFDEKPVAKFLVSDWGINSTWLAGTTSLCGGGLYPSVIEEELGLRKSCWANTKKILGLKFAKMES
jgi:hypothetical protein